MDERTVDITVSAVKADAKQRSLRTLVQGAIAFVLVSVLPTVQSAIANGIQNVDWQVTGNSALTVGTIALISYIMTFARPVVPSVMGHVVDDEPVELTE